MRQAELTEQVEMIPLARLAVSDLNARKDLHAGQEDSGIEDLASSIRQRGLLSPPIVRPRANGQYEVLVGQRRLMACRRIEFDPVPCFVRDLDDADAVALSLVENVHRADMHPLDKARALKALYDRHHSYERVARETTWSASTIRKYIQLLALPEDLQRRIGTADGPSGVGALARLAATFPGDAAAEVYDRISGFTNRIQEEIVKRSDGDLSAIDGLVEEAQEGAFDIRRCGGSHGCQVISDVLDRRMTEADFQNMIHDAADAFEAPTPSVGTLRQASVAFWKALAASQFD